MGVGDSLEATFTLAGPVPAGTWHFVGDGLVFASVDMSFSVLWRTTKQDTTLWTVEHHFDVSSTVGEAVPYSTDVAGIAARASAGDLLVLRFSAANSAAGQTAYIPNGDGSNSKGAIPNLTLPK